MTHITKVYGDSNFSRLRRDVGAILKSGYCPGLTIQPVKSEQETFVVLSTRGLTRSQARAVVTEYSAGPEFRECVDSHAYSVYVDRRVSQLVRKDKK